MCNVDLTPRLLDLTCLLLVTLSYFPPNSPPAKTLAFSPSFISGVGLYIGHLDHSIRRCGMLVAEVVAHHAGKVLNFGDWDGDDAEKQWARRIRSLISARDIDADAHEAEAQVDSAHGAASTASSLGTNE